MIFCLNPLVSYSQSFNIIFLNLINSLLYQDIPRIYLNSVKFSYRLHVIKSIFIENATDMLHGPFDLPTTFGLDLPAVLPLVLLPQLVRSLPIEFVLLLIALLQLGVKVLPHLANYSGDLRYSEVGMLYFDLIVDVHAVEEEGAESLLRWFGRHIDIHLVVA